MESLRFISTLDRSMSTVCNADAGQCSRIHVYDTRCACNSGQPTEYVTCFHEVVQNRDVKNVFYVFLFMSRFLRFLTFFISTTFLL